MLQTKTKKVNIPALTYYQGSAAIVLAANIDSYFPPSVHACTDGLFKLAVYHPVLCSLQLHAFSGITEKHGMTELAEFFKSPIGKYILECRIKVNCAIWVLK